MNQRISIVGLIFSVLVSAESSIILQNVLQSKPLNSVNSMTKMKKILLNKKFNIANSVNNENFHTIKPSTQNDSSLNTNETVSKIFNGKYLETISKKTRFPRQVKKISGPNSRKDSHERPFKVVLSLKPENQEDYYEYYDDDKYSNYEVKNINGLVDDLNLNSEVEINSKPITKTLNESQERKRCSFLKSTYSNLDSIKLQKPQKLLSENIDDKKLPAELMCRDCKLLKLTANPVEPKFSNVKTTRLKQINDDYFINILKQLIDKLNRSKNAKSNNNNDLPMQKSSEPIVLENKMSEPRVSNGSSEEEWIFKLEKMRRNRIMDKLNSSPENTYVNGKWLKNQMAANKKNDCEPAVNEFSTPNDNNESFLSTSDTPQFNLTNSENQVVESGDVTPKNLNDLQTVGTRELLEVLTSPLPEKTSEHLMVSRETVTAPSYLSSTPKNELDAAMVEENNDQLLKSTTADITNESNFSNNEENHTSRDESTVNNIQTTSKGPDEESTSEANNALRIKNLDRILETDEIDNNQKANRSEGVANAESSVEKENGSSESSDCNCNKTVVKNILSSSIISNITEIKTDTYDSPARTKTKSPKRSNNGAANKTTNGAGTVSREEPKVNVSRVSTLIIEDQSPDKTAAANNGENAKTFSRKASSKDSKGEPSKSDSMRKNLRQGRINNNAGEEFKRKTAATFAPKNSQRLQNNSRRFVTKLKPAASAAAAVISRKTETDSKKDGKIDRFYANKKPVFKSPAQTSRKAANLTRSARVDATKRGENIAKKTPSRVAQETRDFPKSPRTIAGKHFGERSVIVAEDTMMTESILPTKTVRKRPGSIGLDGKMKNDLPRKPSRVPVVSKIVDPTSKKTTNQKHDGSVGEIGFKNSKSAIKPATNSKILPKLGGGGGVDVEHAPYSVKDFEPIEFDRGPDGKNAAKNSADSAGPVPIVRPPPESDDYYDDDDAVPVVSGHHEDIPQDHEAIPQDQKSMRVVDGAFRVPLIVSDALVPIRESDGRVVSAVSLNRLLSGDVTPVRISGNGATSRDGACAGGRRSSQTSRDGRGKRVLTQSKTAPELPDKKKLGKAYDHFDSDILNKFLLVYSPPHDV